MGLSITKELIIESLGRNITEAFHLDQLPDNRPLEETWQVIEISGLDPICLFATDHSINITSNTTYGGTPTFNTKVDSGNRKLVSIALYNANTHGERKSPYKGMGAEFLVRSIKYLSTVSPHGVIIGMVARWKPDELNHRQFFKAYDPTNHNLVQAALSTYTGRIASTRLSFTKISRIPGFEDRIPRNDEELSLIFSK